MQALAYHCVHSVQVYFFAFSYTGVVNNAFCMSSYWRLVPALSTVHVFK